MSKYLIKAKVENDKFCTWHSSNLISFTKFLDAKYPNWRYFNVIDNKTNTQIANFTKYSRPTNKTV
jgi:hypothetical protein